jgi:hypothetical protein
LLLSQKNLGIWRTNLPIFRTTGGKVLTKSVFLNWVNRAAGEEKIGLAGKSFRTAIPSAMENFPVTFKEAHVKALGRWKGNSYQLYMKNDSPEFKWVFEMVAKTLLNGTLMQGGKKSRPSSSTEPWNGPMRNPPHQPTRTPKKKKKERAGLRAGSRGRV